MSDGNHDENPRHQHQYDHAHPPDNMTQACFAFYCQWHDNVGFLNFVNRTADYADVVDKKGHEARLALAATEDERERERRALESPHAVQALEAFRRPFVEMLYNRDVDNYLTYVTDLLGLVFSTRPETLRSSQEKETLEFIFQFSNLADLVDAVVEKHVASLSFLGIERLAETLLDKHGLSLFASRIQRLDITRIVETRNLLVHNRGIVNAIFKKRVPSDETPTGALVHLSEVQFMIDSDLLARAVTDVDLHAVSKFSLPTPRTYVDVRQHVLDRHQQ